MAGIDERLSKADVEKLVAFAKLGKPPVAQCGVCGKETPGCGCWNDLADPVEPEDTYPECGVCNDTGWVRDDETNASWPCDCPFGEHLTEQDWDEEATPWNG